MAKDELAKEFKYIGTRPDRPDGFDKVTGRAKYGADVAAVGMLHGAVLDLLMLMLELNLSILKKLQNWTGSRLSLHEMTFQLA